MKKLLVTALVFNFCAADAGLLNSIKGKVGTLRGKVTNVLDQQIAARTAGSSTTDGTLISNPTVQAELVNTLKSMYTEASNIRNKNMLKPKILYYTSNLCVTLQKCINVPSSTAVNIPVIENYIKELQNRNVDVTNLNSQLMSLKTSSTNFSNSTISVNSNTINQTVKQELVTILTEMNTEVLQIAGAHLTDVVIVTNSTLLQRKLQECIANPTVTSASLDTISGYIQKLQEKSINVTSLSQKLALLKEKVVNLTNSGPSVDLSRMNSNVQGEFLSASSELQQEISQIQAANQANATLVSYSGQINTMLTNCSQTFSVTQSHISALNQYAQWLAGQGIDVTNLNQKLTNFNAKAVNLNTAITSANTATSAVSAGVTASTATVTENTATSAPAVVPASTAVAN